MSAHGLRREAATLQRIRRIRAERTYHLERGVQRQRERWGNRMERKLVTCPDSAHLEEIEIEQTPYGIVITACSRFANGDVRCGRECASRLDRRARTGQHPREDTATKKTTTR